MLNLFLSLPLHFMTACVRLGQEPNPLTTHKKELQAVNTAVKHTIDGSIDVPGARCGAYLGANEKRGLERITASSMVSPSLELCFALLYKGPHSFTHIFSGEEQEEVLALDIQPLF